MRILSGIQPSGKLHLGNYFGMMRPALERQDRAECFFFIATYHALTSVNDPKALREATRDAILDFLACGLDPERTALYRQHDVPEVTELAWLLSVLAPMGLLERCHSYKDKIARGLPASHGLFSYPVLMAADILAVGADRVPVGRDQKQHVEVTRELARRFNKQFGEAFRVPEPEIRADVAVVPGLDGQKMSKSYGNTIDLFGDREQARSRVMRIVTDSRTVDEPKDPGLCNVFALYRLFATPQERARMEERYRAGGLGYGTVKKELWERMSAHFEPMRRRREAYEKDPDAVEAILRRGAERARSEAAATLRRARRAVGLD